MANTNQSASASASVMTADITALVVSSANQYCSGESSKLQAVDDLYVALGKNPSYELWVAVMNAWKAQYKTKVRGIKLCSGTDAPTEEKLTKATDVAWNRMATRLDDRHSLSKPAKTTEGATKKAESRKKVSDEISKIRADYADDAAALADAVTAANKAGDVAKGKAVQAALEAVTKEARSKAEKAADEAKKDKLAKIKEALKSANADMLDKLLGVLTGELVVQKKRTK